MARDLIKVLIVDDSGLIRSMLTEILRSDPRIEVVGAARDPLEARELIKRLNPDVLTLDIEMPKMNGIVFLKNLMRLRPMPVVMISTLTQAGAPATLEALEIGAVDFLPKPETGGAAGLSLYEEMIVEKVIQAAGANIHYRDYHHRDGALHRDRRPDRGRRDADRLGRVATPAGKTLRERFICAIGASTGGTEAIKAVLVSLPEAAPPIVITQHIPAVFSGSFAQRLDRSCAITVYEAEHNQPVKPGCAYLAPGDSHLRVARTPGAGYVCKLDRGEAVNRHRPSVEVLYDSVRECAGGDAMGVILTGMGADGAQALLALREAGAVTVAQDEASSVVWGMPGVAVRLGAARQVLPLNKIGRYIIESAYNVEDGRAG